MEQNKEKLFPSDGESDQTSRRSIDQNWVALIDEKLQNLIEKRLKEKRTLVTTDTRFSEDLNMNVVTFMRLMKDVKKSYHLELPHEEIKHIATVGDLQAAIEKQRSGKK